jgi:hypothetical protein
VVAESVWGMNRSLTVAVCIAVIAIFAAEAGADLTWHRAPDELGNYLVQLGATFIGALLAVGLGLALFEFQGRETEQRRSRQLNEALVGELQATLDQLEASGTRISPPPGPQEGEEPVEVVITHLEPVACEEAIRNAILGPQDVFALSALARSMRVYNIVAARLESVLWEPEIGIPQERLFRAAKNLRSRQDSVMEWCRVNIEALAEEGIEIPPKHFSRDAQRSYIVIVKRLRQLRDEHPELSLTAARRMLANRMQGEGQPGSIALIRKAEGRVAELEERGEL